MVPSLGVIGLGQMAQALVEPLLSSKACSADQVLAVVGTAATAERLRQGAFEAVSIHPSDRSEAQQVWSAPVQLLAIKPQQIDRIAAAAPTVDNHPLLVSVLAGVSLARLQRLFPGHRVVRAVPNIPVLVGEGLTALAWGEALSSEQKLQVRALFAGVSEVLELPEAKLDAFLALTSLVCRWCWLALW